MRAMHGLGEGDQIAERRRQQGEHFGPGPVVAPIQFELIHFKPTYFGLIRFDISGRGHDLQAA
jgi:hypothetical protein